MWVHNLSPTLLSIGLLDIRYYGLVYAGGFVLVYYMLRAAIRRRTIKNLTEPILDRFLLWLMIGCVLGARLYHVIVDYKLYADAPLDAFKVWEGGLAFHGGLLGLVLVAIYFSRRHNIRFYDFADAIAIPGVFILGLGRIANFINGEHWGIPGDVSWCVVFPAIDSACRHPVQLYEALKNFLIFGVLFLLNGRSFVLKNIRQPGTLFWIFVTLYGVLRFAVTHFREDSVWPWPLARWLALGMAALGVFVLTRRALLRPQR